MSPMLQAIVLLSVGAAVSLAFPTTHTAGRTHHVKVDPFFALAQTLRQDDLQQRRPIHHPALSEVDYEESQRPANDDPIDLWQVRQLQHQMGQAAMMMPLFQREQRNWAVENEQLPQVDDYGVPIMSEEDEEEEEDEGQLYRDNEEPVYSYFPKTSPVDNEYSNEGTDEDEEKRLLMDTLIQYMYLAGNDGQLQSDTVKRSGLNEDNRNDGQKEISMGSQQKNMNKSSKVQQLEQQLIQQSQEHITNSTNSKMAAIVTPEDELIQELDRLKMKKN